MTRIIEEPDVSKLNKQAADMIAKSLLAVLKKQKTANFGVVGGRNVSDIYHRLSRMSLPFKKVHFFLVDQQLVMPHEEPNNYLLFRSVFADGLIAKKELPEDNLHPFPYHAGKDAESSRAYTNELSLYGGHFDVILLSAGEDGHIAGLYPHHHSIKNEEEGYITMHDCPKPPKDRMTASRKLLLKTKIAYLLFIGEEKRTALGRYRDDGLDMFSCPAKLVNDLPQTFVLTTLQS